MKSHRDKKNDGLISHIVPNFVRICYFGTRF